MKNKYSSILLGIYLCPNCGNISTHNAVSVRKNIHTVFILTGIPATYSKRMVTCSHCWFQRKIKGEFKTAYDRALKNHFDDEYTVKRFINDIEETCIRLDVLKDGVFDEENFEKAVNEIYAKFSPEQGYDKDFYYSFCRLFALKADDKIKKYRLMFRTL